MLEPNKLGYGEYFFTPLERFYSKQLQRIPSGIRDALDIGCGNGQILLHLVKSGTASSGMGIDIAPGAIKGALRLADYVGISSDRVRFEVCDFGTFSPQERFDLVLATQLVNYQASLQGFFRRVRDMTHPHGWLVVSDVQHNVDSWTLRVRENETIRKAFGKPPVYREPLLRHSSEDVVQAANDGGFQVVEAAFGFGLAPRLVGAWMRRIDARDYSSSAVRAVARAAFVGVRELWTLEDTWRTKRGRGSLYWLLARRHD